MVARPRRMQCGPACWVVWGLGERSPGYPISRLADSFCDLITMRSHTLLIITELDFQTHSQQNSQLLKI